nr:TonB-dependent receptor [Brevundimonas subvibrioides]
MYQIVRNAVFCKKSWGVQTSAWETTRTTSDFARQTPTRICGFRMYELERTSGCGAVPGHGKVKTMNCHIAMHGAAKSSPRFLGVSLIAIAAVMAAGPVLAQSAQQDRDTEASAVDDIVVTGTSIRGVAPVGANVITVTREDIQDTGAQTVQELLKSVPQVTGFNNAGQGSFGSADAAGTNAPTIHSLGASASNNTLVLIDGHRLPLTGVNHTLADPSIIPPIALERVEVLPEGASSIYGSDAVAGVLNFITRRRFDGAELQAQTGFADGYETFNGGAVFGRPWETGGVLFAYNYSYRSSLAGNARDFNQSDLRSQGGGNFNNFNCASATVTPASGEPFAGQNFSGSYTAALAAAPCSTRRLEDLLPSESRHSVLFKIEQDIGDRLKSHIDVVYSDRNNNAVVTRGSISNIRAFGVGSVPTNIGQLNPFFEGPAGVDTVNISWSADDLLGPGANAESGQKTFMVTGGVDYELGADWVLEAGATFGTDDSYQIVTGSLCTGCAILGLNGTVSASGSTTASAFPPILGSSATILRLPLTTANALDVWRTGSANRTSAAVREQLLDNVNLQSTTQTIQNVRIKADGPLFSLPGGQVRAAVGAEAVRYTMDQFRNQSGGAGPASTTSQSGTLLYDREVMAVFAELLVPIVDESMNIPLVQRLDFSVAGRLDSYDDFGETTNPKLAFTWGVNDDLSFRGSWGTSFTAPALTSIGADDRGTTGETSVAPSTQNNAAIPVALFPNIAGYLPGCAVGATTCTLTSAITGLQVNGGNADLQPQEGESASIGFDYAPSWLDGFRSSVTYWTADIDGAITAANFTATSTIQGLSSALIFNPTPAQVANALEGRRLTGAVPSTVFYIFSFQQRNAFNIRAAGIDFDASYRFDTDIGTWRAGVAFSKKTKFDQQSGNGAFRDLLNTSGVNTTFSTIGFTGRASLAWNMGPWSADAFANYTNDFTNLNGQQPFPAGQEVDAFTTIDAHLAYDFSSGWMGDSQVFLDVDNLLNEDPPFMNQNGGFSTTDANPIGRYITVGIRKTF